VVAWLPESWNTKLREWQRDEARESILDDVIARNKSINRQTIARVLGF
jgi:hypothetical protein